MLFIVKYNWVYFSDQNLVFLLFQVLWFIFYFKCCLDFYVNIFIMIKSNGLVNGVISVIVSVVKNIWFKISQCDFCLFLIYIYYVYNRIE